MLPNWSWSVVPHSAALSEKRSVTERKSNPSAVFYHIHPAYILKPEEISTRLVCQKRSCLYIPDYLNSELDCMGMLCRGGFKTTQPGLFYKFYFK